MARALPPAPPTQRGAPCGVFLVSAFPIRQRPWTNEWRLWRGGAPLTIPNREVKPRRDDDTAVTRGKVVRRPPTTETPSATCWRGFLFLYIERHERTETASPFRSFRFFRCRNQPKNSFLKFTKYTRSCARVKAVYSHLKSSTSSVSFKFNEESMNTLLHCPPWVL